MLKVYFYLFIEFFKTGLFTFGGGFGSLPFLYAMIENYNWFNYNQLTQLIGISSITPGPIGLNMATFAGYKTAGLIGSFISSIALVIPMLIVTSRIFKLYDKFESNSYVKSILYILKPASCALLASVLIKLSDDVIFKHGFNPNSFDYIAFLILLFLFVLTFKLKKDPIIYILIAGTMGLLYYYLHYIMPSKI